MNLLDFLKYSYNFSIHGSFHGYGLILLSLAVAGIKLLDKKNVTMPLISST